MSRSVRFIKSMRSHDSNRRWHGNYKKEALLHDNEQIDMCFRLLRDPHWRPRIYVSWPAQADKVEAFKSGFVLWFADFVYSDLICKMALAGIGIQAVHLGSTTHGIYIAPSRMKHLSQIKTAPEDLFLKKRVIVNSRFPAKALLESKTALLNNDVVLVRFGPQLGNQKTKGRLFGSAYQTAIGAPYLAYITNRPLLAGFTVRKSDGSFELLIRGPVGEAARLGGRAEFQAAAAEEMFDLHRQIVPLYPDQWRGWHFLRKGEVVAPRPPEMRKSAS